MSKRIFKSHNVLILVYHLVCPAKYRRMVFSAEVDAALRDICIDLDQRYELRFLEIGMDNDHVHFLVPSVPSYSPTKIVRIIKSLTAREIFKRVPAVKQQLWGGEFWSDGFYIATVGQHVSEDVIRQYVKKQGSPKDYKTMHQKQLTFL
jgi:REP element-mobilizing transposase RayT